MAGEPTTGALRTVIEHLYDGDRYLDSCCARCGSSAEFNTCDHCGGDGEVEDDDWQNYDPCEPCRGKGGSWHCISPPQWCQEHPLPGREAIPSTALRAEEWNL